MRSIFATYQPSGFQVEKFYLHIIFSFSLKRIYFLYKVIVSIKLPIAQWLACRLALGEVLGSNPGKGDNFINF